MANPEHLEILKQGVEVWNRWREENAEERPDLSGADIGGADLRGANLAGADLFGANLTGVVLAKASLFKANLTKANLAGAVLDLAVLFGANLTEAVLVRAELVEANLAEAVLFRTNLTEAVLIGANLHGASLVEAVLFQANLHAAKLRGANLFRANLRGAKLTQANLRGANLRGANLAGANLRGVSLVRTNLAQATLTGCHVYGISAWDLTLKGAEQTDLVITQPHEPRITVDNMEVAQFVYLLLNNPKIRDIIDTIGNKAVLILGRFTTERKAVLDALREELRRRDYVPILFDFEKPGSRDLTETVSTLAHMARFVIADLTNAKSIPQELQRIVPDLPSVPVQPILLASQREFATFEHFKNYPWVLETHLYQDQEGLLASLTEVIEPAETKVKELRGETPTGGQADG